MDRMRCRPRPNEFWCNEAHERRTTVSWSNEQGQTGVSIKPRKRPSRKQRSRGTSYQSSAAIKVDAMALDLDNWPEEGRVGVIRDGEYVGWLILLFEEDCDNWQVFISDPQSKPPGSHGVDFWFFDREGLIRSLGEWRPTWVEKPQDARLEKKYFGIRATFRRGPHHDA